VFPRSLLGGDDGFLNFKVITYRYINSDFRGVVDRRTDAGAAPGVVVPRQFRGWSRRRQPMPSASYNEEVRV